MSTEPPPAEASGRPPAAARLTPILVALVVIGLAAGAVAVSRLAAPSAPRPVAASAPIGAPVRLPVGEPAPAVAADGWLNSATLGPAQLRGKVVLYDFWTFGCINCQHTLPYLKAWYRRYATDGLIVLGVHTPEFGYEADPAHVRDYLIREQIRYPVALDPRMTVWNAFGNAYWPAFYLHDRQGHRRWMHIGEGDYGRTEDAIRALLGVDPASPRASR
jgi:thiol-disulfide isomerase/thioredoxin